MIGRRSSCPLQLVMGAEAKVWSFGPSRKGVVPPGNVIAIL
ncbi:hypothetical protein [Bacillus sp. FJAT-27231]|nr:hypothetical protein [Bacillus sp. FJAT-27231]